MRRCIAEDMRVAPFHLVADRIGDVVEPEQAFVGGDLGVKDDLEQQISKLVANRIGRSGGYGVGNLIGFLDRVR